ncbi:MAG: gluconate 2-dehydrogenase subunit 3 family protein [Roseiarcus sp.]|jgi:gluconate 2-dehydrogenase gamma chain|uniref:gluconate 2-dehydrogenase subunit 3 family protein n=1 Tax=Roseiarcus sp. TaxID=1969460 RepID=UPI003BB21E8B
MSPGDSNPSRRKFLAGAIALTPIGAVAAGDARSGAPDDLRDSAPAPDHPTVSDYQPTFFTPSEWAFVNAACARLIPADEHGPGAVELGVPQYIDRQMGTPWADGAIWYMQGPFFDAAPEFGYQSPLTPKQQYRLGIKAIDGLCQERLKKPFSELSASEQDEVLRQIEKGSLTSPDVHLRTFFSSFLLKNVIEGCFGDPMYGGNKDMGAWKMIAYPGVRADYLEWVGQAKPYPYGPVSIYGKRG